MILVDTSGLFSAMFATQRHHDACRRTLLSAAPPLVLSPFVLAELDYLVLTTAGVDAELALLDEVARGAYDLVDFSADDVAQARAIATRHRDLEVGLADASIAVLSRRVATLDVLTLDERHFRTLTGAGEQPFRLLPADT